MIDPTIDASVLDVAGTDQSGSDRAVLDGGPEAGVEAGREDAAMGNDAAGDASVANDAGTDRSWTPGTWFGHGGSDLGPWPDFIESSTWGGGISRNNDTSRHPEVELDRDGKLVVTWYDSTNNWKIFVKRFDGVGWQGMGTDSYFGSGISDGGGSSSGPSIASDRAGHMYIAWGWTNGSWDTRLKSFDGSEWVDLGGATAAAGGVSNNPGDSYEAAVAVDAAGNPIVAWEDLTSGNPEIYVRHFNGSSWVDMGTGSTSGGGISGNAGDSMDPSIATDAAGLPVVVWEDLSPGVFQVYARRFDGATWVELPAGSASGSGVSDTAGDSRDPHVVVDGAGEPLIAWSDSTSGNAEIYLARYSGGSWIDVGVDSRTGGGISQSSENSLDPAIAVDDLDRPILLWREPRSIRVLRFEGGAWNEVGPGSSSGTGIADHPGNVAEPSLIVDDDGLPVVVWQDDASGNDEIYLKRYDGTAWVALGTPPPAVEGVSNNSSTSAAPTLAMDGAGLPIVAWQDAPPGHTAIYARRYDGNAWVEMGAGSATGDGVATSTTWSRTPSIAANDSGDTVVAWYASDTSGQIYVKRFDGSAWVEVGVGSAAGVGISGSAGRSDQPSLAVDAEGNPVVAWRDATPGATEIWVKRFDGTSWVELDGSATSGGVSATAGASEAPSVALGSAGDPYVAWQEDVAGNWEIYLRRFVSGSWTEVGTGSASSGGISATPSSDTQASLALGPSSQPVVAWRSNRQILVRRFDGSTWAEVGAGSADPEGISATAGSSNAPCVVVGDDGQPIVVWEDATTANWEIYGRRFDGSTWQEIGLGSAARGGISASGGASQSPAAAFKAGTLCVAWQEPSFTSQQIVLRCASTD